MLLGLNNVTFSFGARVMLRSVNWQIGPGERIGLVGPNGAGKSTLLRIIMGTYSVESGTIQRTNDVSIGFFNQDLLSFATENSILSVGMTAFEKAVALEQELATIMEELETDPDNEARLLQYSETLHEFELAGGYEMEHRAAEVLEGLGFSTADLQRPYNQFSGGWRMRVLLAKLMLQQPDILMLDEPTNHLDLPSIEWLERYLQSYPGTVIIVSHDRYFLDRMVTKIVELFQQDLISYSGNYSFFEKEKALRMEFLEREYENQQKYIAQQERFVERFKAKASKAKQAQSILKKLDKIERIELTGDQTPKMNISFDVATQPGKVIRDLKHVSKSYGDLELFRDTQVEIMRGDKIALVGANGKGKSTLMRIISGQEAFDGIAGGGHNVTISFYAQHQLESLTMEHTILEELKSSGSGKNDMELRQLLGCFLFSGDDVFKKIKVLSGGEKARVALAKVMAGKANFLLLDEPTNHLDIQSVELLIDALNQYEGTYVLISHDRYFISKTANKYWEIEDKKLVSFPGSYDEWTRWKEEQAQQRQQATRPAPAAKKKSTGKTQTSKADQQRQKELRHWQNEFKQLEARLAAAEKEKSGLEQELTRPEVYSDKEKLLQAEDKYQQAAANYEKIQSAYDEAFEQLLAFES